MKALKFFTLCFFVPFSLFIASCGGGGGGEGGSSDSGTVAMSVTDAKPLLPENVTNLFVEFSEVWVHKSGEGWKQLTLVESPYTIDLLQFQDGNTTELVPPTKLDSGKYTQVRIVVSNAFMRFENDNRTTEDRTLEIPSGNLKTDKNFTIDLAEDSAMDIVIHFDLSMSVVVSGPASNPRYKLKPVLHLFDDPLKAATIQGSINNSSFGTSNTATVVVIAQSNQEEFTRVEVPMVDDVDPTPFSIYWLVPNESYTVQIDLNKNAGTTDGDSIDVDCNETVAVTADKIGDEVPRELEEGEVFRLNGGESIKDDEGICISQI
jgi:hypothetical protein